MKLADLPDIDFVDIDAETIEMALFSAYTSITGRTLGQADPIRLFILFVADVIIRLLNKINDTGKQNLLKYSNGDNLDNLAANAWVTRIPASAATTTLEVTLSGERSTETVIPAGTRVSPESNVYFATDAALRRAIREMEGEMTVFIVSQRTASIMGADRILVLDDGELVGQGTHKELLESCEVYREIYESQLN